MHISAELLACDYSLTTASLVPRQKRFAWALGYDYNIPGEGLWHVMIVHTFLELDPQTNELLLHSSHTSSKKNDYFLPLKSNAWVSHFIGIEI